MECRWWAWLAGRWYWRAGRLAGDGWQWAWSASQQQMLSGTGARVLGVVTGITAVSTCSILACQNYAGPNQNITQQTAIQNCRKWRLFTYKMAINMVCLCCKYGSFMSWGWMSKSRRQLSTGRMFTRSISWSRMCVSACMCTKFNSTGCLSGLSCHWRCLCSAIHSYYHTCCWVLWSKPRLTRRH